MTTRPSTQAGACDPNSLDGARRHAISLAWTFRIGKFRPWHFADRATANARALRVVESLGFRRVSHFNAAVTRFSAHSPRQRPQVPTTTVLRAHRLRARISALCTVIGGWLGHDASPSVRSVRSRSKRSARWCWPLACGVVVLGLQGGSELDAGLEEAAVLADRFEGAVELCGRVQWPLPRSRWCSRRSRAILGPMASAGSGSAGGVEGVDLVGDGEVLIGHGAVGDLGVAQGHVHAAVAEHRGDRLQATCRG